MGNTQSARLHLASLPGIIISTNYDGISHDVSSYPPGIKCRRSNSFQADQIQIHTLLAITQLGCSIWAAQKSCSIKVIYSGNIFLYLGNVWLPLPNKLYTSVPSPVIKKTLLFRGRRFFFCPFLLILIIHFTTAVAGEVHLWTVHNTIWMRRTHGLVPCGDEIPN